MALFTVVKDFCSLAYYQAVAFDRLGCLSFKRTNKISEGLRYGVYLPLLLLGNL